MIDETDMSQERKWFYEVRANTVVKNLQRRNMNGQYVSNRQEALSTVLEMIPPGAVVARGGSVTLEQVGVISEIIKRNQNNQNRFIDPEERDANGSFANKPEARFRLIQETFSADIFLTSANAITLDGKLVNIDGGGNRVSPMIHGAKKVIVVAGVNKIVKDVNEALERIHNVAAPMNAMRHYLKHNRRDQGELPCVRTGRCVDCNHEQRICRYTLIIEGSMIPEKGRINVVLVGEELGL